MFKKYFYILLIIAVNNLIAEIKINPDDGSEDDRFGESVLIEDQWMFIGANRDYNNDVNSGSVYVYTYDQDMNTIFYDKLIPSDYVHDQFFGKTISYDNNWLAVSSIYDNDNGIKSGSVYLFNFNGSSWVEHSKLIAYDGSAFDRYGYSIDIKSGKLAVGSIYDDDNGENSGSVYLYEYTNNLWSLSAKLSPNYLTEMDFFGFSVSLSDDFLAVSAPQSDVGNLEAGIVNLYSLNPNNYLESTILSPEDLNTYNHFGYRTYLESDFLIVSSIYDDDLTVNAGSVYVYKYINDEWFYYDEVFASDGIANDNFGISLSMYNNWLSIGSIDDDNGIDSGSLYLFKYEDDTFIEKTKINPSDGSQYDEYSSSISIESDYLLVGSKFDDDNGNNSGSVYFYNYKGCTDVSACNFNSYSILPDNLQCEFPQYGFECNGECLYVVDECGICNGEGSNGDINVDNIVNIIDVIIMIEYIFNYSLIENLCIIDLNNNGTLNITDVILVIEQILAN